MPSRLRPPAVRYPRPREEIPIVGLGTWITFNVGDDPVLRDECAAVMAAFFEAGGRMIDSSPMYGSSQPVIGYGLQKLGRPSALFAAEKVWTSSAAAGPAQIEQSRRFWGVPKFDLVQVHNLLTWKPHLQTLFQMKAAGAVRYVGITTSEGRRHDLLEQIMRSEPIDFVQFSYNVVDREAEAPALPLAIGARHCRDRQPAVPARRADRPAQAPEAARMGGRTRGVKLGTSRLLAASACGSRVSHIEEEFLHVPGAGRAALGTEAAMQADVFVLRHDAAGLELGRDVNSCVRFFAGAFRCAATAPPARCR